VPHGSIRANTCKHWLGSMYYKCAAGLVPRDLAGEPALGWALRVQCAGRQRDGGLCRKLCPKYERRTPAEVEARKGEAT